MDKCFHSSQFDSIQGCRTLSQLGRLFGTRSQWNSAERELFFQNSLILLKTKPCLRTEKFDIMFAKLEEMRVNLPKVPDECTAFEDLVAFEMRHPLNTMQWDVRKQFMKRFLQLEMEESRLLDEGKETTEMLKKNSANAKQMHSNSRPL